MTYSVQAQSALRMILRKGTQTMLTRIVPASVDKVRDVASGGGPQIQPVAVVIFPATGSRDETAEARTDRKTNQRKLMIAGLSPSGAALQWEPAPNQSIKLEGALWTLNGVSRFAPDGGDPIYFDVEVRK